MTDSQLPPDKELPEFPEVPKPPELPLPPEVHIERPKLKENRPTEGAKQAGALGMAAAVGTSLAAPIIVGALIGVYLDRWLKTDPWLTMIFLFVGIVSGFIQMIRTLNRVEQLNK